jgi:hypothetical protein
MKPWKNSLCSLLLLVVASSAGCAREENASNGTRAAADGVGVAACDDYLTKYARCAAERAPASARGQMLESVTNMRASWKQAASIEVAKRGLEQSCKAALGAARTSMSTYGCTW